jgi:hypothetical protein
MFELLDLSADGSWTLKPLTKTRWRCWFDKHDVSNSRGRFCVCASTSPTASQPDTPREHEENINPTTRVHARIGG